MANTQQENLNQLWSLIVDSLPQEDVTRILDLQRQGKLTDEILSEILLRNKDTIVDASLTLRPKYKKAFDNETSSTPHDTTSPENKEHHEQSE